MRSFSTVLGPPRAAMPVGRSEETTGETGAGVMQQHAAGASLDQVTSRQVPTAATDTRSELCQPSPRCICAAACSCSHAAPARTREVALVGETHSLRGGGVVAAGPTRCNNKAGQLGSITAAGVGQARHGTAELPVGDAACALHSHTHRQTGSWSLGDSRTEWLQASYKHAARGCKEHPACSPA